jgi:hypothetical protein
MFGRIDVIIHQRSLLGTCRSPEQNTSPFSRLQKEVAPPSEATCQHFQRENHSRYPQDAFIGRFRTSRPRCFFKQHAKRCMSLDERPQA